MDRDSRNAASEVLRPLCVPETDSAGEAGLSLCCVLDAVDPGSMLVMMNRKQVTAEPRPPTTMVSAVQTRPAHILDACGEPGQGQLD